MINIDKHTLTMIQKFIAALASIIGLTVGALFALSSYKKPEFLGISIQTYNEIGSISVIFMIFIVLLLFVWFVIILWANFNNNLDLQQENNDLHTKVNSLNQELSIITENNKGLKQEIKTKLAQIKELQSANETINTYASQILSMQSQITMAQANLVDQYEKLSLTPNFIEQINEGTIQNGK
ncbi:hypothetical protein HAU13_10015 [Weissella confusa]|uniref:hypothetical protein n=1 Tax=Weissella confusa TaxID=1583 RepID=UPI0018F161F1|nr:hypothetical protein [Weissella confusa]MBJ7623067.1 hypothetical protein [Weissella confusa]